MPPSHTEVYSEHQTIETHQDKVVLNTILTPQRPTEVARIEMQTDSRIELAVTVCKKLKYWYTIFSSVHC
jgi:hypothetical protein